MPLIQFLRTVLLGLRNVRLHKLRSFLTVLGIVFGVCSVISMLAIGEGASREVLDQIRALGSQNVIIQSVKPPRDMSGGQTRARPGPPTALDYGLRYADAERLAETLPNLRVIVPIKSISTNVRFKDRVEQVNVLGTVPWYPESSSLTVAEGGRFLSPTDLNEKKNVCVLGKALASKLFMYHDPIGQSVRIGMNVYRVVGVANEKPSGGEGAQDLPSQSAEAFVPITTLRAFEGDLFFQVNAGSSQSEYVELHELIVQTNSTEEVIPTAQVIEETLAATHRNVDYKLIVPLRLLEQARRTQQIFSIVLGSIAAISLLVGGIGIMNIMLASVSERTREIGIRRALGARQNDIMLQFLIECLILSVGGGIIGMALGAGIPWIVTRFSEMPTVLTPSAFIISFAVSAFVGVVFGLYPARRAAIMDPIDALRHE
jgi:putative ABC transport system permease protein